MNLMTGTAVEATVEIPVSGALQFIIYKNINMRAIVIYKKVIIIINYFSAFCRLHSVSVAYVLGQIS